MKKSEFIQILEQHQPEETKGQDSETLSQLKSILRHPQVFNLSNDAQLPNKTIEAVNKIILEATNVDSETRIVLDSLSQKLSLVNNTAGSASSVNSEVGSNSNAVTLVNASQTSPLFDPRQSDFWRMSTITANHIFNYLPTEENDPNKMKSRRAFFRVFATTNKEGFESVRQGVSNGMQEQFLKYVADAEMKSVEAILKLAIKNKSMLRKLLTTNKTIIQVNDLPVAGTALEIALKCWDWSSCEGGQEEMAEMLMRYLRMLPEGESLIQNTFKKLFPGGNEVYQEDQAKRANEFAESILEPLGNTLKDASDADIILVKRLTNQADVDEYIKTHLSANKLWQSLMSHHEAIKDFMIKDTIYNASYLQKAFEIVDIKSEKENWESLSKGNDRLALLTIHGVGGIQACSPTLVGMLFARGRGCLDFDSFKTARKEFKVERDYKFKYVSRDVFARSGLGVLLVSKQFYGCAGPLAGRGGVGVALRWLGLYLPDKNTTLGNLCPDAQPNNRLGT